MRRAFAVLLVFFLQAAVQAADKIRIAMPTDAGHFILPLAQKRGFLRDEGLDAEIITITEPVANVALASGDIDYFTGFGSAMRAMLQGQLPTRIVVCYRPVAHFVLLSRPELKTIKDLKGKTFGSNLGGRPDLIARLIIKHFGLDPDKDIKFTRSTTDTALARMQQGLMDATVLPVPRDYQAVKMGFNVLARAEDLFTYPISGLIAHTRKIKDRPDEIRRVIRAGIKANRYMRANRDGTIEVLMSTYRLDKEAATALYSSFVKGFNDDGNLPEAWTAQTDRGHQVGDQSRSGNRIQRSRRSVDPMTGAERVGSCNEIAPVDQSRGAELCLCREVGTNVPAYVHAQRSASWMDRPEKSEEVKTSDPWALTTKL